MPVRERHHGSGPGPAARGFTIVELTFSIFVIFLIMGILLVSMRYATRAAKGAVDTSTVNSLKVALDQFRKEFGFYPPLVKDLNTPLLLGTAPNRRPAVYSVIIPADLSDLRGGAGPPLPSPDLRFTIYGLAYYVMGALPEDVDGKAGAGFMTPTADGTFAKRGRQFEPFFDTSRSARTLYDTDSENGRIELRDNNNIAFRYYRWLHDAGNPVPGQPINQYLNIPDIVGDPETRLDLRNAEWAIVAAGRDGLFGDEYTLLVAGHPQALDPNEMGSRLNVGSGLSGTALEAVVRAKAKEDNIVVIGGSK